MKQSEGIKTQNEAHERKMKIRTAKAHDYANADCLANFKVMADLARALETRGYKIDITRPWGVAMWHLLHKVVRLLQLYNSNVQPENESAIDSHDDLEEYSELCKECYIDELAERLYKIVGNPT